MKTISFIGILFSVSCLHGKPAIDDKNGPIFQTVVTTRNVTRQHQDNQVKNNIEDEKPEHRTGTYIDVQILDKPHNLFIGRCARDLEELHNENIILTNDGKSHVTADIKILVSKPVDIKCVKVLDQNPGEGAYPSYIAGGLGYDFVEIGVNTEYGKGFHFFVQILGKFLDEETTSTTEKPKFTTSKYKYFRRTNRI